MLLLGIAKKLIITALMSKIDINKKSNRKSNRKSNKKSN